MEVPGKGITVRISMASLDGPYSQQALYSCQALEITRPTYNNHRYYSPIQTVLVEVYAKLTGLGNSFRAPFALANEN